ncbi:RNA methyltransferase [Prochlorococcus marinus]|uniref:RNA methyltransferase n=1 Tax=Prochlorococcus marinus TaxID=1219 RepID=UPI0022B2DBD9|nr:RNA methyltransferase [Prochlorococcus marinus]
MDKRKIDVKIILVEPIGEINLGSIARLCKNFDVNELRLVSPRCDPLSPDSLKMAMHGKSFLENAKIYKELIDAVEDCGHIIATCGRIDHGKSIPLNSSKHVLEWILKKSTNKPIALVFGREDRGLSNTELLLAQKVISIQTSKDYPSLNLSHAVAIILNNLYTSKNEFSFLENDSLIEYAPAIELNNFIEDAKKLLLEIGFLHKHTAKSRMSKIQVLLQRGEVRSDEIALIRGILRQLRWFHKKTK